MGRIYEKPKKNQSHIERVGNEINENITLKLNYLLRTRFRSVIQKKKEEEEEEANKVRDSKALKIFRNVFV